MSCGTGRSGSQELLPRTTGASRGDPSLPVGNATSSGSQLESVAFSYPIRLVSRRGVGVRPKVFGYIRSSRFDPVKLARLQHELEAYAEREDLTLGYVFTDNGFSSTSLERPGLVRCWIRWLALGHTASLFLRRIICRGSLRCEICSSSRFKIQGQCCTWRPLRRVGFKALNCSRAGQRGPCGESRATRAHARRKNRKIPGRLLTAQLPHSE